MTKNIKFRLVKFEKALAFQILDMNEGFRLWLKQRMFQFNKSFDVESINAPCLYEHSVALRGSDKSYDLTLLTQEFEDNGLRDKHVKVLIFAIQAACAAYKETLPTEDCGDQETFEF